MLNVGKIEEGFVLDHIEAGKSLSIYHHLQLDKLDCTVAIIKNARSNKMGKKDILKVECDINTLDLDILLFGQLILDDERLCVPHYHMHARPFVLLPLAELCPADFQLADGRLLADLLKQCPVDPTLQRLHTPQLCTI